MKDTADPSPYDPEDEESAPVAYEVAVRLWTYQGIAAWDRFSAMLLANSIVLVAVATLLAQSIMLYALPLLPLAGIALCIFWFTIFERGAEYELHYIWKARELEPLLGDGGIRTVRDGHDFGSHRTVLYHDEEKDRSYAMACTGRFKTRRAGRGVILTFVLVHVVMFVGSSVAALNSLCVWIEKVGG
jgi:hypothetical protein